MKRNCNIVIDSCNSSQGCCNRVLASASAFFILNVSPYATNFIPLGSGKRGPPYAILTDITANGFEKPSHLINIFDVSYIAGRK
jgi:hypothetical protein